MVALTDLGPLTKVVVIRGLELQVGGVSARGIMQLIDRFPLVRRMFSARDVAPEDLLAVAPEVAYAVIAAGLGKPGDKEQEEAVAEKLALGEQADLLLAVFEATFPKGVDHFVDRLAALGVVSRGDAAAFVGTGWDQATKSESRSNGASPPATPEETSTPGTTPPESLPAGAS